MILPIFKYQSILRKFGDFDFFYSSNVDRDSVGLNPALALIII